MAIYDITFHPAWWHKRTGVSFDKKFFLNPDYRIQADMLMRHFLFENFPEIYPSESYMVQPRPLIDSDLLAGEYLQAQLLGCDILFTDDNLPEVQCAHLTDAQIEALSVPDLDHSTVWAMYEKQMKTLISRFGHVESYLDLCGVQNLAFALRGQELFIDYYENPRLAHHLLTVCTQTLIAVADRLRQYTSHISTGVSSILGKTAPQAYLTSNCTVDMISADLYETYLMPYDIQLAEHFGVFAVHHCGMHCERFAPLYRKPPNLVWLEAGAHSDFHAVRSACENSWLNLRYSPQNLLCESIPEIQENVRSQFSSASFEKRNDFTSMSCVGIDVNTPDQNVIAFCRAIQDIPQ